MGLIQCVWYFNKQYFPSTYHHIYVLGTKPYFLMIFEFLFCLVLFFMLLKKLSTFKFFLKIATFFKKSQTLKTKHVRSLIHLSLVAQLISFFYLEKRQSFIGLWNQLKENVGNSNFALLNQKTT